LGFSATTAKVCPGGAGSGAEKRDTSALNGVAHAASRAARNNGKASRRNGGVRKFEAVIIVVF
jgi:hypothetical protein